MLDAPELPRLAADRFVLLFLALLVEAAFGGFAWLFRVLPHPYRETARLVRWLDRRLNREKRGAGALLVRGAIVAVVAMALAVAAGWGLARFLAPLRLGWLAELAMLAVLLAQRPLYRSVSGFARRLAREGLVGGRAAATAFLSDDPSGYDVHALSRAAIEHLAGGLVRRVTAPAFWYILLGLPGLFAYVAVDATRKEIGGAEERHLRFGLAAARLADALAWIPARLVAVIAGLAAVFVPTANPFGAFRTVWRDANRHPSSVVGWPIAAMAGALDLQLAGPRALERREGPVPWIGTGRARATTRDVHRALLLFGMACVLQGLLVAGLAILHLAAR